MLLRVVLEDRKMTNMSSSSYNFTNLSLSFLLEELCEVYFVLGQTKCGYKNITKGTQTGELTFPGKYYHDFPIPNFASIL